MDFWYFFFFPMWALFFLAGIILMYAAISPSLDKFFPFLDEENESQENEKLNPILFGLSTFERLNKKSFKPAGLAILAVIIMSISSSYLYIYGFFWIMLLAFVAVLLIQIIMVLKEKDYDFIKNKFDPNLYPIYSILLLPTAILIFTYGAYGADFPGTQQKIIEHCIEGSQTSSQRDKESWEAKDSKFFDRLVGKKIVFQCNVIDSAGCAEEYCWINCNDGLEGKTKGWFLDNEYVSSTKVDVYPTKSIQKFLKYSDEIKKLYIEGRVGEDSDCDGLEWKKTSDSYTEVGLINSEAFGIEWKDTYKTKYYLDDVKVYD